MGCGCCIPTFRDEVEGEVFSYIKRLKKHDETKNKLIQEIQKDLIKRAETVEKYKYPYRHDDVEKTVKIYKNYIYKKFKGNVELLEDKIKTKENEEKVKNIKKDDNKLKLKEEEKNKNKNVFDENKIVDKDKEEKKESNNNEEKKKEENKDSMANNRNEEKLESVLKSDLHPMLDNKIKNYSEKDDSKEQKEKSIDNIQQYLPKREDEEHKSENKGDDKKSDNNDKEEVKNSLKKEIE